MVAPVPAPVTTLSPTVAVAPPPMTTKQTDMAEEPVLGATPAFATALKLCVTVAPAATVSGVAFGYTLMSHESSLG